MGYSQSNSTVGAYDAKTRFSHLLERVEKGEEITITRHGVPVALLIPARKPRDTQAVQRAIDAWRAQPNPPTLGDLKLKHLIEEGRP